MKTWNQSCKAHKIGQLCHQDQPSTCPSSKERDRAKMVFKLAPNWLKAGKSKIGSLRWTPVLFDHLISFEVLITLYLFNTWGNIWQVFKLTNTYNFLLGTLSQTLLEVFITCAASLALLAKVWHQWVGKFRSRLVSPPFVVECHLSKQYMIINTYI